MLEIIMANKRIFFLAMIININYIAIIFQILICYENKSILSTRKNLKYRYHRWASNCIELGLILDIISGFRYFIARN